MQIWIWIKKYICICTYHIIYYIYIYVHILPPVQNPCSPRWDLQVHRTYLATASSHAKEQLLIWAKLKSESSIPGLPKKICGVEKPEVEERKSWPNDSHTCRLFPALQSCFLTPVCLMTFWAGLKLKCQQLQSRHARAARRLDWNQIGTAILVVHDMLSQGSRFLLTSETAHPGTRHSPRSCSLWPSKQLAHSNLKRLTHWSAHKSSPIPIRAGWNTRHQRLVHWLQLGSFEKGLNVRVCTGALA